MAQRKTNWQELVVEVWGLIHRLQRKPKALRLGYYLTPGGIINAYTEGDLTFKQAVAELKRWKKLK